MSLGPPQAYLAKYNSYILPGYVQTESIDSLESVADHYAPYSDGSRSESTGLANKSVTLSFKVWEQDYLTCKEQVQLAATMLRSKRNDFAQLYVQFSDRYYSALTRSIKMQKDAGKLVKTLDYDVEFECKPWSQRTTSHTLTGTGTVTTDAVGRTIDDGGWTPTIITVTGTNVQISGVTASGDSTGLIQVVGSVTNLVVNTEAFTAKIGSTNRNDVMGNADYQMYVGPGKTTFTITGASSCSIVYTDRWYI
jgi:hypothetical protein